ncbi:hypothetical protein FE633_24275 [Streptomyces montanus]|uniref:Uncharacterized protein n=1 Tax=Streptomyces montanus TaxID=2580423 RepID=A0A5R9FQF0_9ACTN|nr:hypothetical protein [Streptomyces montanus]TLS43698.1 hypothetical protein FE633_24275 [Streptomyces montanus]
MRLPIDPQADRARRAWVACPGCDDGRDCATCTGGRNCSVHWRYLLANEGARVHLQCPSCTYTWTLDTRRGRRAP